MWAVWSAVKAAVVWMLGWLWSKAMAVVQGGAPGTVPTMKNSALMESASTLAGRIRSGKVTSVEVVRSYIERIEEVNEVLNCVVDERFEEALAEAKEADNAIRSGTKTKEELEKESPFLGVPFTSPEAVGIAGLCQTLGAASRRSERAKVDASAIAAVKEAGGIPIACTNVSEWCALWETNNPLFGKTRNPYNTKRSVGGPFGGEACLIAACGSPLGISPSVTLPCMFNGIFGHKPSENATWDAVGPLSRSSADLLPALRVLTRNSNADLRLDEAVDLKTLKYYFMDGNGSCRLSSPVDEEIKGAIRKAVHHFRNALGATVERTELNQMSKGYRIWRAGTEASRTKAHEVNLYKEIVMALFGRSQHTVAFLLTLLTEVQEDSQLQELRQQRSQLLEMFQEMLGSNGVFIYPTHPSTAHRHNDSLPRELDFGYSAIFDALGLPATHCPTGLHSDGLPIGFQVVAALNQDRLTVAVAKEIDKALGGWTPPPTRATFTLKNTLFHTASDQKLKVL